MSEMMSKTTLIKCFSLQHLSFQIMEGPYDFRDHGIADGIAELAD